MALEVRIGVEGVRAGRQTLGSVEVLVDGCSRSIACFASLVGIARLALCRTFLTDVVVVVVAIWACGKALCPIEILFLDGVDCGEARKAECSIGACGSRACCARIVAFE